MRRIPYENWSLVASRWWLVVDQHNRPFQNQRPTTSDHRPFLPCPDFTRKGRWRGGCMSSLAMSRAEREAFLAATHVAVVSIGEPERGPLTVPVWYRYEPGDAVRFVTGARSRKASWIRQSRGVGVWGR